jgi:hypothetical protein
MIRLLLRCYPECWRARYGEEFAALLAERPLGPFDVADVLYGALDARLHFRRRTDTGGRIGTPEMSSALGGYAAVLGGLLSLMVFAMSASGEGAGTAGIALIVATTALLLVALTGLSAFQARRYPRLIWAAFTVPAVGAVAALSGVVAMVVVGDHPFLGLESPWLIWALGTVTMLVGSGLFAIATWRVGVLPRAGTVALAIGAIAAVPVLAGIAGSLVSDELSRVFSALALVAFSAGWVILGVGALQQEPAPEATPKHG